MVLWGGFSSWNSRRAKRYRKANGIPDSLGTAVTIQAMVFGNVDEHSGTGVLLAAILSLEKRTLRGVWLARKVKMLWLGASPLSL